MSSNLDFSTLKSTNADLVFSAQAISCVIRPVALNDPRPIVLSSPILKLAASFEFLDLYPKSQSTAVIDVSSAPVIGAPSPSELVSVAVMVMPALDGINLPPSGSALPPAICMARPHGCQDIKNVSASRVGLCTAIFDAPNPEMAGGINIVSVPAIFGFKSSIPPRLEPLRESFTVDDIEEQLQQLFIDLFERISVDAFDAINLGAPNLGTFDLVRRAITADGLALLNSEREDAVTRYLHKAWSASDNQGRGLHFLRTYLQMLYPNEWQLFQLEQDKSIPYPYALRPDTGNRETHFLTSRIKVLIDGNSANAPLLGKFVPILTSVIAARLVIAFETYKMLYINGIYGAQVGMLGIANPTLGLSNDNIRADVSLGATWGGHATGAILPQGLTGVTQPGAAFFMTNYFAPIECPAVCIVSRNYCCDPERTIDRLTEAVVRINPGVGAATLGVLFDKRTPVASGWPDEWQPGLPQGATASVFGQVFDGREPLMIGWPYGVDASTPSLVALEASPSGVIISLP